MVYMMTRDELQTAFNAADAAVVVAARNIRIAERRKRQDPAAYVAADLALTEAGAALEAAEAALVAALVIEEADAAAAAVAPDFVNLAFQF